MAESETLMEMKKQLNLGGTDQAGLSQSNEPDAGPLLIPLTRGIPHRVILFGDGIPTWCSPVWDHLAKYCIGKEEDRLRGQVTQAMGETGVYYANSRMGEQAIMVLRCPTKIKTKDEVQTWLEWWVKLLDTWDRGGITVLISPSKKYDPITKMTAQVLGVEHLLEGITAKATSQYSEHRDLLQDLKNRGLLLRALQHHDDEHSVVDELIEQDYGETSAQRDLQEAQESADGGADSEEDSEKRESEEEDPPETRTPPRPMFPGLPMRFRGPQTPTLTAIRNLIEMSESQKELLSRQGALLRQGRHYTPSLTLDRAPIEVEDGGGPRQRSVTTETEPKERTREGMHRTKTEPKDRREEGPLQPKSERPEHLPALTSIPPGTRKVTAQGGLVVYHWIGSPWDIDGHGLIVLTNSQLRIHHGKFRKELTHRAGREYKQEVESRKTRSIGETEEGRDVIVTSGGNLAYYAVIHLPIAAYPGAAEFGEYQKKLLYTLDRGLDRAREIRCERVVMCVDGLRSSNMIWEEAETTAMGLTKMFLRTPALWGSIQELVVVTSEEQYQERLQRALASVQPSKDVGGRSRSKARSEEREQPAPRVRLSSMTGEQEEKVVRQMRWQAAETETPYRTPQSQGRTPTKTLSPRVAQERDQNTASPQLRVTLQQSHLEDEEDERYQPDQTEEDPIVTDLAQEMQGLSMPKFRVKGAPSARQERTTPVRVTEDEISDSQEEESDGSEDMESVPSVAEQAEHQELRVGRRKGEKKEVKVLSVRRTSEKLARDITWGPIETRDGRQAHVPEANQLDYHIPEVWAGRLEDQKTLEVTATLGEWANIIQMPSFPTLAASKELTANFRMGYLAVAHDVMLRRMKKAAVKQAIKVNKEMQEDISGDEEERQSGPTLQARPVHKETSTRMPTEDHHFKAFKTLQALVRPRRSNEDTKSYVREVWPLVEGSAIHEGGKKLWLSSITSQPADGSEPARKLYERLVLEDMDDEDHHIARAKAGLEEGQTLVQLWHVLKQKIPATRYVKALRKLTAGKHGELAFITMPVDATVPIMDTAVRSWDLEGQYYAEKRKKEAGSSQRKATEKSDPRPPPQGQYNHPPATTLYPRQNTPAQDQRQQKAPPKSQPGPQQSKPTPAPRGGAYLNDDDYRRLTPEQKRALAETRKMVSGGPKK